MRKILLMMLVALCGTSMFAQVKIYLNPGHGSWGPDDRPLPTIPYPMLAATGRPDTCGFYESNTNLWKTLELGARLTADGYLVKHSRRKNGPYPYRAGAANATRYNKELSVICEETDSWGADMFLSVHSNAAGDGAMANYPLFLYRGYDAQESVKGSVAMCKALWPTLTTLMKSELEYMSYYNTTTNIRGDIDFYHGSITTNGYTGYLGALRHGCPGFLSEGYFHTYQPARHRALNQDWCRQEGIRYYRGIINYFKTPKPATGCIMGIVKTKRKTMDGYDYYAYNSSMHDMYMPLNGTEVRLRNRAGEEVARYQVDDNYNGVFVFNDLMPGYYYADTKVDGYTTSSKLINVKANDTAYALIYKTVGESTEFSPATGIADVVGNGGLQPEDPVEVVDASGKVVLRCLQQELSTDALPHGVYIVKSGNLSYKIKK